MKNVFQENGREECSPIKAAIITRWGSRHKETACANTNQVDLKMAIDRLVCKNGIDEKVYLENKNNLEAVKLNESDWELY